MRQHCAVSRAWMVSWSSGSAPANARRCRPRQSSGCSSRAPGASVSQRSWCDEIRWAACLPPCDRLWSKDEASGQWRSDERFKAQHQDWVRDVAWAPNLGLPKNTVATASQDGTVR
eukprot:scaffold5269_cov255-Prasinococcus_capsulatus_cf.AAC.4